MPLKMTAKENWLEKEFPKHQIRQGRTMEDPDFPRIAITYSLEENAENSSAQQDELAKIMAEYNAYYGTSWTLQDIERYNGDINNRLARKKQSLKNLAVMLIWLLWLIGC